MSACYTKAHILLVWKATTSECSNLKGHALQIISPEEMEAGFVALLKVSKSFSLKLAAIVSSSA